MDSSSNRQSLQRLAQDSFAKAKAATDRAERTEHLRACSDLLVSLQQVEQDPEARARISETLAKVAEMLQHLGSEPPPPPEAASAGAAAGAAAAAAGESPGAAGGPPAGSEPAAAQPYVMDRIRTLPALENPSKVLLVGPQGNELGRHARYLAAREHGQQRRLVLCPDAASVQALDPAGFGGAA